MTPTPPATPHTPAPTHRPVPVVRARAVAPGRLVFVRAGDLPDPPPGLQPDTRLIGMKTIRHGKGFIAHYLLPLAPAPADGGPLMLMAVDTDTPMTPADPALTLALRPAGDTGRVVCGQVVENASGRFFKVQESYKDAFSLAYVEITAGDVRRRQDRGVIAVHDWHLEGPQEPPAPSAVAPASPAPVPPVPPVPRPPAALQALRIMTPRDVEAVAALLVATGFAAPAPLAASEIEHRLRTLLSSPLALCLVAELDDAVVGVALGHSDGFAAHLSHVAVTPSHARRGIGRTLVEAVAEAALAHGATDLRADAPLAASAFAAALGFTLSPALRLTRPAG